MGSSVRTWRPRGRRLIPPQRSVPRGGRGHSPRSGRGSHGRRARLANDAAHVEVVLHDARCRDQVRVARDRPREPVDIGGLEVGDLSEGVAVELAEHDLVGARLREAGWWWRPEVALAAAVQRPSRLRGTERLALETIAAKWWLAGGLGARTRRRVARPERGGGVDAAGHGAGRARLRRPVAAAVSGIVRRRTAQPPGPELPGGTIDLCPATRRPLGGPRKRSRHGPIVLPGEGWPGGL